MRCPVALSVLPLALALALTACTAHREPGAMPATTQTDALLASPARRAADLAWSQDDIPLALRGYASLDAAAGHRDLVLLQRHAEVLVRADRADEAAVLIDTYLPAGATDPLSQRLRALSRAVHGKPREALRILEAQLAGDPDNPQNLYYRALARLGPHQYLQVAADSELAVAGGPFLHARLLLARADRYLGRLVDARNAYEAAIAAAPRPQGILEYADYLMKIALLERRADHVPDLFDPRTVTEIAQVHAGERLLRLVQEAVRRDPSEPRYRLWLCRACMLHEKPADAFAALEQARKDFPGHAGLALQVAEEYLAADRVEDAAEVCTSWIDTLAPATAPATHPVGHRTWVSTSRPAEPFGRDAAREEDGLDRASRLDFLVCRGEARARQRDPFNAVWDFTRALDEAYDTAAVMAASIRMTRACGAERAVMVLRRRLEKKPGDMDLSLALAEALYRNDQPKESLDLLARLPKVLSEFQRFAWANTKAFDHRKLEQFEEALAAWRSFLADHPDHLGTLNEIAYMLADDLKRPVEALPYARRMEYLLAESPPDAWTRAEASDLDTVGYVYLRTDRIDAAERLIRASLQHRPSAEPYIHLAEVYRAQNRIDEAREALDRALSLKPVAEVVREKAQKVRKSLGRDL